jgi:large subunit ribosomal protein L7/L12
MSEVTREQVVDFLSNMPVMELSSLIAELETKWGVSARPAQFSLSGGAGRCSYFRSSA